MVSLPGKKKKEKPKPSFERGNTLKGIPKNKPVYTGCADSLLTKLGLKKKQKPRLREISIRNGDYDEERALELETEYQLKKANKKEVQFN